MISEKLQKAINEQITAEMWSSNLYLAMSFFFEKEGFSGFAHWMKKQSQEEMGHAYAMADYIIKRGGTAMVDKIDVVPNGWGTPLEVFEHVYKHECHVSALVDKLVDVAAAEKDKATQDFLWGFVREQVEEEATAQGIVDKIKKAENELNRQMRDEMYISLNDFYYEIGLDNIKLGDELGWNINDGYIDLSFSSQLTSDETPCLVIDYAVAPRYDYRVLM